MSCYHHHGYGYGHGCDGPPPADWYDAYGYRPRRYRDEVVVVRGDEDDFDLDEERPRRRRGAGLGRRRRYEYAATEEVTAASLQSRAEALREELVRIEEDLKTLSAAPGPSSET